MRAVDIIQKKQLRRELSPAEVTFFLEGYLRGEIPDYQVSAFLMAVYFNGLSPKELGVLTRVMIHSGEQITFPGVKKFLLDKHSTGGVGDKTTLALIPIFAAFDIVPVKLTGQGLGHTGGTTDKLESIPGFTFPHSLAGLRHWVKRIGIGLMSYSDKVVPLDKKLYTLRDVTSTVASIPLIAASIMSKKLAVSSDAIILDVKVGEGAFMKNRREARALANVMIGIGKEFHRRTVAVLSGMNQPLGNAVGNSLEVIEAIETLKGRGPQDFTDLVHTLTAIGLKLQGKIKNLSQGKEMAKTMIASGKPLEKFRDFIAMGTVKGRGKDIIDNYSLLPTTSKVKKWVSPQSGYVAELNAENIGNAAMVLGAGRMTKEDVIDPAVGIVLRKKIGDAVKKGEALADIHYRDSARLTESLKFLRESLAVSDKPVRKRPIVLEIIE